MFLIKLQTFIKSLLFHVWAGFPKSTLAEIYYRYDICQQCERFDKERSECMECGCSINNKKIFMNKLAWADQECPLQKWKALK